MENKTTQTIRIGELHYNNSNLERAAFFFEEGLGLKVLAKTSQQVQLGTLQDQPLITLHKVNNPPQRKRTTGLYHLAIRLPTREDLAKLILHLVNNEVGISGVADHGVSESVYLAGPEGLDIELTCDRQKDEWPFDEEGNLDMITGELDLDNLILSIQGKDKHWAGFPAGTSNGHIHLRVAQLPETTRFYNLLGFQVSQIYGDQAVFFADGGYHHQIGTNTWQSAGAEPADPDSAGLWYFEILFSSTAYDSLVNSLTNNNLEIRSSEDGIFLKDPNGIQIKIKKES